MQRHPVAQHLKTSTCKSTQITNWGDITCRQLSLRSHTTKREIEVVRTVLSYPRNYAVLPMVLEVGTEKASILAYFQGS
jgi:hypothetical protein